MFHTVQFRVESIVDLEVAPDKPLQRVRLRYGERRRARLTPYVIETALGPTEVADLLFDDGTITRRVGFWRFALLD